MPGTGAFSHVGIGKEAVYGTPVVASDHLQFVSEALTHNIEELVGEYMRGIVDEAPSYEGMHTVNGDVVVEVHPQTIGYLFRMALGAPVTTGAGPYVHTFTPVQADFSTLTPLPPYTLEVHRDLEQAWQFASCVANSLKFAWGIDQKIMRATMNVLGKDITLIAKTTPTLEAANPFLWHQGVHKVGGPLVAINTLLGIEIDINNNLEGVSTLNGQKTISRVRRNGYRVISTNFTFDVESLTEYTRFKNQTETAFE